MATDGKKTSFHEGLENQQVRITLGHRNGMDRRRKMRKMRVRYLLTGVVVLCAIVIADSSYARIDLKTVVGMRLFDEGEGEIAEDSSGNGNNVRLMNGTIIGAEVDGDDWFNGFVDEVGILNVVLTVDDIQSIMTEGLELDAAVSSAAKLITTWASIKNQ